MTPLKRQKMEEITSPTPEKKTKTKEANDQQLSASPSPSKVLLRPSKLGTIGTEAIQDNTIQDSSDLVDAENSPFARGEGNKNNPYKNYTKFNRVLVYLVEYKFRSKRERQTLNVLQYHCNPLAI